MIRLLIFVLLFSIAGTAQEINKITIEFKGYFLPYSYYEINFEGRILNTKTNLYNAKTALHEKRYSFSRELSRKFKMELGTMNDKYILKGEDGYDGGAFKITCYKDDGTISKLTVRNATWKREKYGGELKKIEAFFNFAFAVIKDKRGLEFLNKHYSIYKNPSKN